MCNIWLTRFRKGDGGRRRFPTANDNNNPFGLTPNLSPFVFTPFQKCEIRYETVFEQQCTTTNQNVCQTINQQECSTVNVSLNAVNHHQL